MAWYRWLQTTNLLDKPLTLSSLNMSRTSTIKKLTDISPIAKKKFFYGKAVLWNRLIAIYLLEGFPPLDYISQQRRQNSLVSGTSFLRLPRLSKDWPSKPRDQNIGQRVKSGTFEIMQPQRRSQQALVDGQSSLLPNQEERKPFKEHPI